MSKRLPISHDGDYLGFLMDKINDVEDEKDRTYFLLTRILFEKEFYWLVPNDDNRDEDGKMLRTEYEDHFSAGQNPVILLPHGPARILEVLIALAYRMEFEISGFPGEKSPGGYFWEMIDNLGLMKFDDEVITQTDHLIIVGHLDDWLDRRYEKSGLNGIFPLERSQNDQRNVEIWYQMYEYIDENYTID